MLNRSYWLFELHHKGCAKYQTAYSMRFFNDKVEYESEKFIVLADGLVLNKNEFSGDDSIYKSLCDYYLHCYEDINAIKGLIGPFTTIVFNKQEGNGIAFANQTGDSSIFYGYDSSNEVLYLSNNFNVVAQKCQRKRLNEKAAHYLLTYGFIVDDSTIVDGIFRLQAGKLLRFGTNGIKVEQYHRFNFHDKKDITLDEAIEQVDVLFRKAVKRCFDKDIEYGYTQHLADMSAGLDSRMTNVVAKDLGYTSIVNISYSQSGSDEQKIAQSVAQILGNPLYHRSLDDATFLYNIDDTIYEEFGMAYYSGITGGRQFLQLIDFTRFGLEHTGQIGDVVISSFVRETSSNIDSDSGRMSDSVSLRHPINTREFSSNEEFLFYTRAFQGALSTHYMRANYTYTLSPFLDPELIAFCASIPDEIRANHRLYWNWIDKKYPEFGRILSTRQRQYKGMGIKHTVSLYSTKVVRKVLNKTQKSLFNIGFQKRSTSANNMNPFQYWYETNNHLRSFVDKYYKDNIELISDFGNLKAECQLIFQKSSTFEKLMCLSLLGSVKRYCKR